MVFGGGRGRGDGGGGASGGGAGVVSSPGGSASPTSSNTSPRHNDKAVGRSLSADELDSGAALQTVQNGGDGGDDGHSGIPNGVRNVGVFGGGKKKKRTSANGVIGGVVSASTSALPHPRTFAGRGKVGMGLGDEEEDKGGVIGDGRGAEGFGGGRNTMRNVGGMMRGGDEKEGGLWKRLRNRFKAKAQNARGSFRFDRGAFSKLVSRRNGENGAGGGRRGDGREGRGYGGRRGNGVSASSASLRRERFGEGVGNGDGGGKKKGKRRKNDRDFRSLPKRVLSSPPNFPGRSGGRKSRFSHIGRSSGIIDVADHDANIIPPRYMKNPLGGRGMGTYGTIVGSSINLAGQAMEREVASDRNAANFRRVLEETIAGRLPFTELLDTMFTLEERLNPEIKEMLIKYLSKQENMETLIKMLTVVVPNTANDPKLTSEGSMSAAERIRYRYSYVSSMLLMNGPIGLRRALFLNSHCLDQLVNILGVGVPTDHVVVSSVCKVLLSVLRDSPDDSVRAMLRRKDFIPVLLSHIAVTGTTEVCLSMVSTVRCQADLKFGSPNKAVVKIMAETKVQKALCAQFADAVESGPQNAVRSATIENCSRCIVGIALRALVIPRFEINNDDADADYMKQFNKELVGLDLFQNPEPIMGLVDVGLRSINKYDTRGYGLSTALTAIRYILVTCINAQDSSSSSIRMQLMNVSTTKYEEAIGKRIPDLTRMLANARKNATVVTMWESVRGPLGVMRLKIMELLIVLQQHGRPRLSQIMVESGVPGVILSLFKRLRLNSLYLHIAATLLEQSFRCANGFMRRAFLIDNQLIDELMNLWMLGKQKEETRAKTPVADQGELLRVIIAVRDFLKQSVSEVQRLKKELGMDKVADFFRFCEGEVAERIGLHSRLLCGLDALPSRHDDGPSFEDLPGFGGSEGALYFRERSGAGGLSLSASPFT